MPLFLSFFNVNSEDLSFGEFSLFFYFLFFFFSPPSLSPKDKKGLVSIPLLQEAPCNLLETQEESCQELDQAVKNKNKQNNNKKNDLSNYKTCMQFFYIVEICIHFPLVGKGIEITIWKNKENCFSPPA